MNLDSEILQVPIEDIIPNRFQPRISFDDKALQELSNSIKQHGIIQPLVLRKLGDKYEIIAGERRYKAATMAGLTKVPAVIADIDDNTSAEVALVENVQRKNLTSIEEAKSYKNILDKGYMTQEGLAKKMGLSQSAIANKLRLLNLAEEVQDALLNEKISERHARALLVVDSQEEQKKWLKRILDERLTVRQLDMEIKKEMSSSVTPEAPLINIEPNIEEIKANAIDITNEPKENYEILDNIKEVEKSMPNKFFNFLEDEPVVMGLEESSNNSEVAIDPLAGEPIVEDTNTDIIDTAPVIDLELPAQPIIEEEIENLDDDFEILKPSIEVDAIPVMNDEEFIDPMSLVDTLDPAYEETLKEAAGLDLKTAINSVRDCITELNSKGFVVDIEELDLENNYQINIKINKE
ncbi:MAG: ParB/RepB/Spo0J family partition protein [Bacilli bacterium]|nr:ParB/RepB/Spo0J family partition protein [Bacilli bacterium]